MIHNHGMRGRKKQPEEHDGEIGETFLFWADQQVSRTQPEPCTKR
jgi:hypothetical protein